MEMLEGFFSLANVSTSTLSPSDDPVYPIWVGYLAVGISVIFFGSNFVPAAKYPIGDGLSFQFFLCCGIWITGLVVNLILGNPPFYPLVLIGGVLWTTGNVLSVFVIPINGLGMSMLLWCTSNLFMGWASGHFGWFALKAENVEKPLLNYFGVAIACLSGLIFLGIRSETSGEEEEEERSLLGSSSSPVDVVTLSVRLNAEDAEVTKKKVYSFRMRLFASFLAIVSGIFFGLVFTSSTYIQDHRFDPRFPGASKNGLDYIFAMYTGILLASILYYSLYIVFKRNRPYLCRESILPAFISGVMWGIAQAAFLLANSVLSQAISFPLISIGPATIAALWSIFYFRDIRGRRNFFIFSVGTLFRFVAALLIILSKPITNS